jgi:hypothetical protein
VTVLRRNSTEKGSRRKVKPDFYTLLLVISLVALIIGCVLLYLEVAAYGPGALSLRPESLQPGIGNLAGGSLEPLLRLAA